MRQVPLVPVGMILGFLPWASCSAAAAPAPPTGSPASEEAIPLPDLQSITVENADQVRLLRTLEIPDSRKGALSPCSVAFSPDGRQLVAASGENRVPIWDVETGSIVRLLHDAPIHAVACAFSPSGAILACGGFDKTITCWDATTGEWLAAWKAHDDPVWDLTFSRDESRLASCSPSSDIRLWNVETGKLVWSYPHRFDELGRHRPPLGRARGVVQVAEGSNESTRFTLRTGNDTAEPPVGPVRDGRKTGQPVPLSHSRFEPSGRRKRQMKLCIPVAGNEGMESAVFGHFGSAPIFAVHDTSAGQTRFIDNANVGHEHGSCNPLGSLGNQTVDAILVGGIGARAIARLNEAGIKVYRAVPGTLSDALEAWTSGRLEEITPEGACKHHGGCAH